MARVHSTAEGRRFQIQETRVTAEPPAELPPASRRTYGAGDLIDGKYQLEELIGTGGMGTVWTARNQTLGVQRAVKLIRADADSAESTDRLLHEAQAAARLADPAIVRVFDFGKTPEGDPYIVMELLEGEDLMSIINRRERLSPSKAVRVLLPVIRALGAAHAHGIVHRDLKPENIFLARLPDGRVQPKLLDFGIAKLKNARDLRLTSAGSVVGSPLYMAPEQARGEDVDERADIWALCVVLYEAISGRPPFYGDDRAQVMHAVATLAPENPKDCGLDAALWSVLERGLAKRRDDRWSNMEELGRTLARWLLDGGTSDDITGANLESGWFRGSRRSLFASSLPPLRAATARARDGGWRARAHAAWTEQHTRAERLRRELARLPLGQRFAVVGLGVTALTLLGWLLVGGTARENAAPAASTPMPVLHASDSRERTPPSGPDVTAPPGAASGTSLPGATDGTPSAASTTPDVSAAPPAPALRAAERGRKSKHAGTRKSAPNKSSPARETPGRDRRSRLIDPYQ
jgi:serine/threonine-protein kinase